MDSATAQSAPQQADAGRQPLHSHLLRQLRRLGLTVDSARHDPDLWRQLLEGVSRSYHEADQGRYLLERSLSIASTEMQELYQRLRVASEERYRDLFDEAPVMYVVTSAGEGVPRIIDCNELTLRTLRYKRDALVGLPLSWLYPHDMRDLADCSVSDEDRPVADEERTLVTREGQYVETIVRVSAERDPEGALVGERMMFIDVSRRKELQRELAHQAFHDALTSLPNRVLFQDRLEQAMIRAARAGRCYALALLDLDDFKLVNDSLGHGSGDELLVNVSQRLREAIAPGDTLARLGGDEFTLLMEDVRDEQEAMERCAQLADVFAEPFMLSGHEVFMRASIGVVLAREHGFGGVSARVTAYADIAMYEAKRRGKGTIALFDESLASRATERLELESRIRHGIENNEFVVHYQPVVDLPTGRVSEFEALVRWQHPERGLLPPSEFLGVAEQSGLVVALGRYVLEEACREAQRWRRADPSGRPFRIAVNLSAREIERADIVEQVEAILSRTGLPASYLKLEVTESVMMNDLDHAERVLRRFHDLGIKLAIDDFGTGYCSLTYLKRLPVDTIKMDRSFVTGLEAGGSDAAIIGAVLAFAASMELTVTGEGVESASQAAQLREMGCTNGQGYLFARPMPGPEARLFLDRRRFDLAA